MTSAIPTEENPTTMATRTAEMQRLSWSRPSSSVPNQCSAVGGESGGPTPSSFGSYGEIHGPMIATTMYAARIVALTRAR